jgi:hypothetical protein
MVEHDEVLFKRFHDDVRVDISEEIQKQGIVLEAHPLCVKVIVAYMHVAAEGMALEDFVSNQRLVINKMVEVYGVVRDEERTMSLALFSIYMHREQIQEVIDFVVNR